MRRNLVLLTFLFCCLFACKHEPEPAPASPETFLPNCKLLKVIPKDDFKSYTYEYDSNGRLSKRVELWNGVPRVWYVIHYSGNKMISREQWTDYPSSALKMTRLDTLIYNNEGKIIERRVLEPEDNFSVHQIYKYAYDNAGFPVESKIYRPATNEYSLSYKYLWENGNIVKKEDYEGNFEYLMHEWFYEYGLGINHEKITTVWPEHPEHQNYNIVKAESAKDYTGLLDLLCNPCSHQYDLNDYDLPTRIHYGWDKEVELTWDCQ